MDVQKVITELEGLRKEYKKRQVIFLVWFPLINVISWLSAVLFWAVPWPWAETTMGQFIKIMPVVTFIASFMMIFHWSSYMNEAKRRFKYLYKRSFVVNAVEELVHVKLYEPVKTFTENYIARMKLFRDGDDREGEDYFSLGYKGHEVETSECNICIKINRPGERTNYYTVFRGELISVSCIEKRTNHIQIFSTNYPKFDMANTMETMHMVEMESTEFNQKFYVLAADEQEAYYVLTPQVMEALCRISEKHAYVLVHLWNGELSIGLGYGAKNKYNGDISKEVVFEQEVERIQSEIREVLEAVDVFLEPSK